jgi:hypothetical protein
MGADASQRPGDWRPVHDELDRLGILAHFYELDIPLDIDVSRAGHGARRPVQFGNGEGRRDRLGIRAINGLTGPQIDVEFVLDSNRADLGALAATGAFLQVDVAGLLIYRDFEIAGLAGNIK